MRTAVPPLFVWASLALCSVKATAEEPAVLCHARVECAKLVKDQLSTKFVAHYPAPQWQLFVLANSYSFEDGSGAAQAIVGVTVKLTGPRVEFPLSTTSYMVVRPRLVGVDSRQRMEAEAIQHAVRSLMAACEGSPECAVE
jgi:hypothetical protein